MELRIDFFPLKSLDLLRNSEEFGLPWLEPMKDVSAIELAREFCNACCCKSILETLARQREFLELSFNMRSWRAQNGDCPTEELRTGLRDHFWELGEAEEMHKSCEAVDRLEEEIGKGSLSQASFVMEDPMGAIVRLSCFC